MSVLRRLGYALGNAGFGITGHIVVVIGIYYYLPPGDVPDLEPQLASGVFAGVLTAYGLARLLGGLADSLADPVVGHLSDRSRSKLGRRRSFMIYGIAPMVVAPALLFWPPGPPGGAANFVFLTAVLTLYFVFFTAYVAPYLALLPEIARTQEERVDLSRLVTLVGLPLLVAVGPAWQLGVGMAREAGVSSQDAIRAAVLILCGLSFLLCLVPILVVDERRLPRSVPSDLSMGRAVGLTLRNRPLLIYLAAQVLLILGVTMVQPLAPYLAEVILGRDLAFASILGLIVVVPGAIGFMMAQAVVRRLGPKGTLMASVTLLGVVLCCLGLVEPDIPGGSNDRWNLFIVCGVMGLLGLTLAAFLIIPNVMIGQLIDRDEVRTGANRSAMYYGAQGLFTKWAYAASAALMSFLFVRFGNSQEEPLGVLLVGPIAGVLCLVSVCIYALYPERQVLLEGRDASPVQGGPRRPPGASTGAEAQSRGRGQEEA